MKKVSTIACLLLMLLTVHSGHLQAKMPEPGGDQSLMQSQQQPEDQFPDQSQDQFQDQSQDQSREQAFTLPTILKSRGMPAYPFPVTVSQPDGSAVELRGMGDGFLNWYETTDGYTVLRDGKGYYMYAVHDGEGRLVPSDIPAGGSKGVPGDIQKNLRHSASQVSALKKSYFPESGSKANPNAFPSTGSNNVLVILVEFADLSASLTPRQIENMMTAPGYGGTGSFRDYYLDVSYNNLSLVCTVVPWVQVSRNMSYYGANDAFGYDIRPFELVREAVDILEAGGFDFAPFDNDGDGYVDEIVVVHAGYGEQYTGAGDTCIWSHSYHMGDWSVEYDGVILDNYLVTPELFGNSGAEIASVGTVVHEFSHSLGLPDLYDVDGEGSGGYAFDLNFWDLMAVGSWNNEGRTPAGINAWLKRYMGWMDIPVIDATGTYTLEAAIDNPQAFRLNTPVYNEYFIVENRQRTGFDSYLPGEGMLIYHVDLNYPGWLTGEINVDPLHQGFDLLEADDIRDTITLPGDPFPGTAGITGFDSLTVPGSNTRNGMPSQVSIQNITSAAGVISFEVLGTTYDALPAGWSVDELAYTQMGLVTAMVDTGGNFVTAGTLAAFVGGECRGIASAMHDPSSGNHLFVLHVFSNATGGEELSFRYYDPGRDSIYTLFETLSFMSDTIAGTTADPFLFHVPVRYTKDFVRGWNWFSLNVAPKDMSPASVLSTCASAGDYVKNQTSSTTYYGGYGWFGTLRQMGTSDLYVINATGSCGIDISGLAAVPSKQPIELVAGWNWVAYHPQTKHATRDALASLSPTHLDYIKNQSQSATYYNGYGWFGTLDTMRSGEGYMMRLATADLLQYPDAAPGSKAVPRYQAKSAKGPPPWSYNASDYEHSGELNAVVIRGGEELKGGYLGAFVGDECRGYVEARVFGPTGRTIFVLLIGSNESSGETITFRYYDEEEDRVYFIEETLPFVSNMRIGSAVNPEEFHVSENSPPVADCPPAGSVTPLPGPVVFDFCRIFSDPDGDPLVYDVEHSANSKVSWISECELEFTAAEEGTSTLTLIASDGKMQAECSYSFTIGSSNSPPELVRPLGVLRLDEGFEIFTVDLDTVFRDPDGDRLAFEAVAAYAGVVTVSVEGSRLVVAELVPGNVQVRVSASDGEFSAVDRAEVVVVADGPSPPWQFNPANYLYKGQIDAQVMVNGASVTSGVLGAFVGRECRGFVKGEYFSLTGKTVFSLLVHSNRSEGDMLTFRYYDTFSEVVFATEEVIPFRADMKLGNALNPVPLNIISKNHLPVVDRPIGNQVVDEHFGSLKIALTEVFSDPDSDPLTYRVVVDDPSVAVGAISEGVLTIGEVSPGVCRFVVSASDGVFSIDDRFSFTIVNVNDPPEVVQPVPDQLLQEGFGVKSINISGTFWDPDGDVLQYSVSVDDPSVVVVSLSGSNLVIVEAGTGEAVVTLCVSDGEFEVCDAFNVTVEDVNHSPVADCTLFSDTVVHAGSGGFVLEAVCDRFSDPDGDELTFTVASSDPAIALAVLDGCSLGVTVLGTGIATITVCAGDGELEVCCAFEVVVVDENAMELFVMDRQLFEGDTIGHCSEADTVVLIVYSVVPWDVESEGAWFTVTKTNIYNAEIVFSENETGAARSGSVAVRDTQEHIVNLAVHQSADCSGTSVAAVGGGSGVRCYPNPVSGRLAVELEGELFDGAVVLELIDVYGKRLQEVLAGEVIGERGAFFLEMGKYQPGVYFLRIADAAGPRVVVPVVKE